MPFTKGYRLPPEVLARKAAAQKGKKLGPRSELGKQHMREAWVRMKARGVKPPVHNMPHTEEAKERMSRANIKRFENPENHPRWTGDLVKYDAVHKWIYKLYGKADRCENLDCVYPRLDARGKVMLAPKRYEWAALEHAYTRDRKDWAMLCPSCHQNYDKGKISPRLSSPSGTFPE